MGFLTGGLGYILPFLVILTVLVFVHELGHYLIARRNGVRVEVFSIGFGPEVFGWNDRAGTRWKFSAVPLGGYVKMFGDADPASMPSNTLEAMTEAERTVSFHYKRLPQRAAIVAAGPAANFLFAVALLAILFATVGQPFTPPDVGQVLPGSAAEAAGIKPGDVILAIDGRNIERFEEIQQAVELNTGTPLDLSVRRDGRGISLTVTPQIVETTDRLGVSHKTARIGIARQGSMNYVRYDPASAAWRATTEVGNITEGTLRSVWQMIIGARSSEGLSGPLGIGQMAGEVAQNGIAVTLLFMAILSVNLGLINLFPIPVLDGGHLLFYVAEAIRGRPLGQRAQEYGFKLGLALVLTLMVFATWNDLVRLRVVELIKGWVT